MHLTKWPSRGYQQTGMKNPKARFDAEIINTIRSSNLSNRELADKYLTSIEYIGQIKRREFRK